MSSRALNLRPHLPLLLLLVALLVMHSPGLFAGKVYGDEDVIAVFFADKCRLRNLLTGRESWSFWDPLPFLGMPRLANYQMAWFSPDTLFFGLLDPLTAWRFYPFLGDLCLLGCTYFFLRPRMGASAAWLGAGFYVFAGDCLKATQDHQVKSTMMALLLILGCNQRWLKGGRRGYLAVIALATYWQMSAGAVSHLYYQSLTLPFLVLLQVLEAPAATRWQRTGVAVLTFVGASLIGLFPWFPLLEWSAHGSRQLLEGANFTEAYRLNLSEVVRVFADELVAFWPQGPIENGGGYSLSAGFSLALLALVVEACRRDRGTWPMVALAVLISLQMLGDRGFILWLLHKAVPYTQQIRGPHRFFFTGGLLWVQVAAIGLDSLLVRRRWLAWSLSVWALSLNIWVMGPQIAGLYLDAAAFAGPPLPPAGSDRMAVNFAPNPKPPLQWLPYPITQGRATLIFPNVLCEGNYFRGLLYSQYGARGKELLPGFVYSFTPIPPRRAHHPLLRSWGLSWVLQPVGDQFGWEFLGPSPRFWTVVRVEAAATAEDENRWAARDDWAPAVQACLSGAVPSLGSVPARILSVHDRPDEQVLETEGESCLLLSNDSWDPGWECLIDGRPVEVRRANVALKACLLPQGRHQVRWRYRLLWPRKAFLSVTLGGLILAAVVLLTRKKGKGAS